MKRLQTSSTKHRGGGAKRLKKKNLKTPQRLGGKDGRDKRCQIFEELSPIRATKTTTEEKKTQNHTNRMQRRKGHPGLFQKNQES